MSYFSKMWLPVIVMMYLIGTLNARDLNIDNMNSEIPFDPEVTRGTLDNGLQFFIKKNTKPENRLELMLVVKAGAVLEEDDQDGLAHFCEHMAFNGTKNFPKQKLIDYLESTGVRFGPDLNAFTSWDRTVYMLTIPTDTQKLVDNGFQVLEDWASNISFDPEEIEKERGVIMEEWRLGKGAMDRCEKKHRPVIYYNSRYAERDIIGDTNVIKNAPRERFTAFYNDWYRPDLMAVIAVGDIDKKEIESKIREHFGKLKNPVNAKERKWYDMPPHEDVLTSVAKDKELDFPNIRIYFKADGFKQNTWQGFRNILIGDMVSSMLSGRLNEINQKPDAPFNYFVSAYTGRFPGRSFSFSMYAGIKADKIEQAAKTLLQEAFRAKKHGFTETEIQRAKDDMIRMMKNNFDERDKFESKNFAFEYMRHITDGEAVPGIPMELKIYEKFLPEISLDEVNAMADEMIRSKNAVIALSAPEIEDVDVPDEDDLLDIFEDAAEEDLTAWEDDVSDKPLFDKKLGNHKINGETYEYEVGIYEYLLDNLTRVIVYPTDNKNDEILLYAFSPGGTSLAPDSIYHSAAAADNIVSVSGISHFTESQLEKKLAGKYVSVYPYINKEYEGIRASCSVEDFETMLQLVYLYFTSPGKDSAAFRAYIEKRIADRKTSMESPFQAFNDTIKAVTGSRHLRATPWEIEDYNKIDLDEAVRFYKERFADANDFIFIIAGNFDQQKHKQMLVDYLGSLPVKDGKEKPRDTGVRFPQGITEKFVFKGMEDKSRVYMLMETDYDLSYRERFNINAMKDILNIILRERIREEKGGTYGIYSFFSTDFFPEKKCRYGLSWGCNPERVDELTDEVLKIISELKQDTVDEKYITKVKEIQKRKFETDYKENRRWINWLEFLYKRDMHPVTIKRIPEMIENISAEDIRNTARKYLRLDNYARFVLLPEKMKAAADK